MRLKYRYDQLPTKSDKFNSHSNSRYDFFLQNLTDFLHKNKERTAVSVMKNCWLAKKLSPKKSSKQSGNP